MNLGWLPHRDDWNTQLAQARRRPAPDAVRQLLELTRCSIDFVQTSRVDKALSAFQEAADQVLDRTPPIRLAILGSSTFGHLLPGIRVACARRGFQVDLFEGAFGSYHQQLADPGSALHEYHPDVVLLALDAHHVLSMEQAQPGRTLDILTRCWDLARRNFGATIVQQTVLPGFPSLLGNNEHRHPRSPQTLLRKVNEDLRVAAAGENIVLLSVDELAQVDGIQTWFDPALWHATKQEVHLRVSPLYGDHVARLLAAVRGLSYKCLVLDLDHTLWGGVIGDDGLDGIHLGQGHASGEAYLEFQRYAKALAERGVILAVCSKNDPENARLPFERHPEMVLRLEDIACFVANWQDKATNLRLIAETLNIGLDTLVFADDNPFERNLIRRELPMVAVPELPEDPSLYASTIAAAGYFEAVAVTGEDLERTRRYSENKKRDSLREQTTDLNAYLTELDMKLIWSAFEPNSLTRVAQLIQRSNQFNLTTRRYHYDEVKAFMEDPSAVTLQLRLTDAFGDNGIIAVVIGRLMLDGRGETGVEIDTWLMSCRVLGRQVEEATLNVLAECALRRGATSLTGFYLPTAKNSMVRDYYKRLGFECLSAPDAPGSVWRLSLAEYVPRSTSITPVHDESHSPALRRLQ